MVRPGERLTAGRVMLYVLFGTIAGIFSAGAVVGGIVAYALIG